MNSDTCIKYQKNQNATLRQQNMHNIHGKRYKGGSFTSTGSYMRSLGASNPKMYYLRGLHKFGEAYDGWRRSEEEEERPRSKGGS